MQRRKFLLQTGRLSLGAGLLSWSACTGSPVSENSQEVTTDAADTTASASNLWFQISLAQWSLHRTIRAGKLDNLDFAKTAREAFDISAIEYVNQFFADKGNDIGYLKEMKQRADDHDIQSLLIMIDSEGDLGATDMASRTTAIENHYKWVEAAKLLGCHSIRVNAAGTGSREAVAEAASDGLRRLSEFAAQENINVIVENHGGYSSDGSWLASVIQNTGMTNCGTLPDFGNFCVKYGDDGCAEEYDRYKGVQELMPFAKAVSAKSNEFDEQGNEINIDYRKMLSIVKNANYNGFVGIEYEGSDDDEMAGIQATIDLLVKAGLAI